MSNRLRENIQNRKLVQQHYSKKDGSEQNQSSTQVLAQKKTNIDMGLTTQQKMKELQLKVTELLEDLLYVEIFNARCHDSGESTNMENAKLFKEDLLKRNVKNSTSLNLQSLRLGINAMIALSN